MATRQFAGSSQHFNGNLGQRDAGREQEGMMGQVRAATEACQTQAQQAVTEYPLSTVLACFGIGVGVGVVLGSALFSSSSSSNYLSSSAYPSSFSNWLPSGSSSPSSWFNSGNSGSNWFGNSSNASNWGDNLMQGAKSMCGY